MLLGHKLAMDLPQARSLLCMHGNTQLAAQLLDGKDINFWEKPFRIWSMHGTVTGMSVPQTTPGLPCHGSKPALTSRVFSRGSVTTVRTSGKACGNLVPTS